MIASSTVSPGRLRDSRDIASVFRGGRQRAGRLVVLHALDRASEGVLGPTEGVTVGNSTTAAPSAPARLTVTASRKVGSAVARNRAKRLLREAARRILWSDGTDVVLVARRACAASTMPAVLAELQELARALDVTQDAP